MTASASSDDPATGRSRVFTLSSGDARSLQARAERIATGAASSVSFQALCDAANAEGDRGAFRLAVVADGRERLVGGLRAFLDGRAAFTPSVAVAEAPAGARRAVFVFSGYGSQWNDMTRSLLDEEPVFRATFERCASAIERASGIALHEHVSRLEACGVDVIQPLLFATQLALAALWRSWGVAPSAVVGLSLGEITAACDAGALSIDDAARIICAYSELQHSIAGRGAMALIERSPAHVAPHVARHPGVVVAAVNGPETVLVSGSPEGVRALVREHVEAGVFARTIDITVAAHSPQIDAIAGELEARLASIAASAGSTPIYSTVTGARLSGDAFGGAYWAKNLRAPVLFRDAMDRLLADGHDVFIEVSPHPVLLPAIDASIRHGGPRAGSTGPRPAYRPPAHRAWSLSTLRRGEGDRASMLRSLARAYTLGCAVAWPEHAAGDRAARDVVLDLLHVESAADVPEAPLVDDGQKPETPASIERQVCDELAALLGVDPASVGRHATFVDLGLDSQRALVLAKRLIARFDVDLPTTIAWTAPTVSALAGDVARRLGAGTRVSDPGPGAPRSREPIAIVGVACRFPGGADTPAAYWSLLREGRCATRETPRDRFDLDAYLALHPEAAPMRFGGFLDRVDLFEPEAFGISPREAASMDPQQRLWLEVTWEALENAGLAFDRLAGTATGLFVGTCSGDYARLQPSDLGEVDTYTWMGASNNMLAGRVAYLFDFRGPALVVDTACSSSLVAVHLACESLRRGESDVALAGGVNLILSPICSVSGAKMNLFASDGRCKTFDATADGMVRAEGCGVVVLKRLSDAVAADDRVLAVIRGTAVNQDGRSNGLTAPNGDAQRALLRRALADAGVGPEAIGYVEAHGTATPLGDPIELGALADVFGGRGGADGPCAVASVKTNLGHLEGAAGIAGLIKVVLALKNEAIPPHLHFHALNPHASLDGTPFVIPVDELPWRRGDRPRRAGVSSFGWSGTNAHVVLEEAPAECVQGAPIGEVERDEILPLSAHAAGSLRDLAGAYAASLRSGAGASIGDVAFTAGARRGHRSLRVAVVGGSNGELADALDAAASERVGEGAVAPRTGRVAFVFSGHGSQWRGMGRELFEREEAFRASIERCDAALRSAGSPGVVALLTGDPPEAALKRIDVIHPFLFAMHVSLAALLESWGLAPDGVVGHSLGEVAAAHVAGGLGLDDAARVIWERSRLVQTTSGRGAMTLAELTAEAAEELVKELAGVVVAAVNGPETVLLSGDAAGVREALSRLESRRVFCRALDIDIASHGPQMDPLLAPLEAALSGIRAAPWRVPFFSTVSTKTGAAVDAAYWARNLRSCVRFDATARSMLADGYTTFVEVSPHPVLVLSLQRIGAAAVATVRRHEGERRCVLDAIARAYELGAAVDWSRMHGPGRRVVDLPTYRWRRARYWIATTGASAGTGLAAARAVHPLFPRACVSSLDGATRFWDGEARLDGSPWSDHRVQNAPILPAAVHVEAALRAARAAHGDEVELADLSFERPIEVPQTGAIALQLAWSETEPGRAAFHVASRAAGDAAFTIHARGVARAVATREPGDAPPLDAIAARCASVDVDALYAALRRRGVDYGPRFRGIARLSRGANEAWAELAEPSEAADEDGLDPITIDLGFQVLIAALAEDTTSADAYLPLAIESVRVWGRPSGKLFAHATVRTAGPDVASGDVVWRTEDGRVALEVRGLFVQRLTEAKSDVARWLFDVRWEAREAPAAPPYEASGPFVLFADGGGVAARVADRLVRAGHACAIALRGDGYAELEGDRYTIDPRDPSHYARVVDRAAERSDAPLAGIVYLAGLDAEALDDDLRAARDHGVHGALHLVQALAHAQGPVPPRLFVVTRGAQPVSGDRVVLAQSLLWGLARVLPHEHPELRPKQIDLPSAPDDDAIDALARELTAGGHDDQVALRGAERLVARFGPVRVDDPGRAKGEQARVRADATYLITGGMGGLGLVLARALASRGARHIVLMGRSAPRGDAPAVIDELRAAGVDVVVARGDVSRAADVKRVLDDVRAAHPPLAGIVHAAMVLDDGVLLQQSEQRFDDVLGAKALGAIHLHEATRETPLDFFVLFASVAAVFGLPGQANYAAGNAFLDALAHARRREGLPALSIDWGPWSDVGAAAAQANRGERLSGHGMLGLSPDEGIRAFEHVLGLRDGAQVTVLKIDPRQWRQRNRRVASLPFFADLFTGRVGDRRSGDGALRREIAALPAAHRKDRLDRFVRGLFHQVLRVPLSKLDEATPIATLGFDSLMALELRNRIEVALDLFLPSSLLWTHRTLGELASHLGERMDLRIDAPAGGDAEGARDRAEPARAAAGDDPIAIVGMACRFPGGANDPEAFWRLLAEGRDAIVEVPKDRWDIDRYYDPDPMAPGKMSSRWGGFVDDVVGFDADFFGIPAREAKGLDPQQRILLEVAWEALEDAGQPPPKLRGSQTGVFVGICYEDYRDLMEERGAANDAYVLTGNVQSFAAGRVSYALDLQGPSVVVNTACSSSLVAVDLACKSLREGASDVALAGAVNVILSAQTTVLTSKLFALSPEGRCKTFDASASGIVRGEGCGVVVLKRLSDARAAGDRVLAVILSSAVNQDGQSAGLTAPNVSSQRALLSRALHDAGVRPDEISYVEAHGTGTALGDPIEVEALKAAIGAPRPKGEACALASVKTNIGHLESAAGMAGLIKTVLALRHDVIPKHLHFKSLNPNISLDGTPFVIPEEALAWPRDRGRRVAGVSSFGLSGTNAHVIVADPPEEERAGSLGTASSRSGRGAPWPLVISAKSQPALRALAARYAEHFASHDGACDVEASCRTAATRRAHHAHRLFVSAEGRAAIVDSLRAFAGATGDGAPADDAIAGLWSGEASSGRRVAFVFSGQGSSWVGMGRSLLAREPAFRAAMEACDAAFSRALGWSVLDALARDPDDLRASSDAGGAPPMDVVQPILFSMQVALAALWRAWGVRPSAVVGHSVGEVAAAHVAGALSLDDAVLVLATRSRLLESTAGRGAMALVEQTEGEIALALGRYPGVSVASVNGPEAVLVAGAPAEVDALVAEVTARGAFAKKLHIAVAAHSPQVDALTPALVSALAPLRPAAARVPLYSTVTAAPIPGEALDAGYWAKNLRETVRFHDAVVRLLDDGHDTFLEISPHPVLLPSIERSLARRDGAAALPSLTRDRDERASLDASLGQMYALGCPIDFRALFGDGPVAELPTYPFQHTRFWFDEPARRPRDRDETAGAPLLGSAFAPAAEGSVRYWETQVGVGRFPYLADHRVQGSAVFPAAAYVEMALEAAGEVAPGDAVDVADVSFERMLVVPDEGDVAVQIALRDDGPRRWTFQIYGRDASTGEPAAWTEHARGVLVARAREAANAEPLAAIDERCAETVASDAFYRAMADVGIAYGPAFRGLSRIRRRDGEAIADVRFDAPPAGHRIHPALLDACFQALAASLRGAAFLPVSIGRLRIHDAPRGPLRSHFRRTSGDGATPDAVAGDITVTDDRGAVVMTAFAIAVRRVTKTRDALDDLFYETCWLPAPRAAVPSLAGRRYLVVTHDEERGGTSITSRLRAVIEARGGSCVVARPSGGDFVHALRAATGDGHALSAVVHVAAAPNGAPTEAAVTARYAAALHIVQAVASAGHRDSPRVFWVTRGAQATFARAPSLPDVASSVLWGFARTVAHEHPELRASSIDLDPAGHPDEAEILADAIAADDDETLIALRGEGRRVGRWTRAFGPRAREDERCAPAAGRPFRVEIATPGRLDDLTLRRAHVRPPGPGEIAIDVVAAALNFVDVLRAMGIYPGEQPDVVPLGGECAGRVAAIGEGVTGFAVGDEVIAIATHAMGTYVVADARLVAPKPASISFAEAASLPLTFITSIQALSVLGRLARGERVLIHSATGGMGLTAIQIARRAGAEIFATAGTEAKREYLRSIGIRHVMDSRSLDFADEVARATGGRGVDVIMNSLAGPAIAKGLSVLAPYGRFIEIGKKDIYDDAKLGLFQLRQNAVYATVDLVALLRDRPDTVAAMLHDVVRDVAEGTLAPLPVTTFAAAHVEDAFRLMAKGEHIGKVVVTFDDRDVPIAAASTAAPIDPRASYLVTGGLGGLGIAVAEHLVDRGARRVVLMGRSAPKGDAERTIARLRAVGAEIHVERGDVAREADVARVLDAIAASGRPLRGIVHSAVVLDDGVAMKQTAARFSAVMAPKVLGAWNLHVLSRRKPLDFFALFSSAASVLGSAGQASYSAANAFLDALAHHRAAIGLPAVSIAWGPWGEIGQAAAASNRGDRLAAQGMQSLARTEGLRAFERLLASDAPHVAAVKLDFRQWRESNRSAAEQPFFAALRAEVERAGRAAVGANGALLHGDLRAELEAAPPRRRRERIEELVARVTSQVLRTPGLNAQSSTAFGPLGIDSLMSLELRNRLEAALGVKLSSTLLWTYKTVGALTAHLAEKMSLPLDEPAEEASAPAVDGEIAERLAAIEELSDEDAEAALLAKLEGYTDLSDD